MKVRQLVIAAIVLFLISACVASSQECKERPGAAVLPYTVDSAGNIKLLLAHDTRGFWSDFGGGAKYVLSQTEPTPRCEKPEETAVREAWEESRFLLSRSLLISALKFARTIPESPRDSDFVTFVIRMEDIDLSPYYSNYVVAGSASAETDQIAWFELTVFSNFVAGKTPQIKTPNGKPLRKVFLETLRPVLINNPETIFKRE